MKLVSASLAVLLFPLLLVVSGGIVTVTANAEAASVGGENQASADADANAVDESAAVVGGGSLRRGLNHRQRPRAIWLMTGHGSGGNEYWRVKKQVQQR